MDYLVLVVVIGLLAAAGFSGYRKGFVHITLSLVASIAAVFLASILAQPVGKLLKEHTSLYESIEKEMSGYISEYIDKEAGNAATEISAEVIDKIPLPSSISKMLLKNNSKETIREMGAVNLGDYISRQLSMLIVNAIAFIGLFVILNIVFKIVISMLDVIARLPVLKQVNHSAGFAIGLLEGLLLVWVLCLLLTGLTGTSFGQEVMKQISENSLLSFIYKNNPLIAIFTSYIV